MYGMKNCSPQHFPYLQGVDLTLWLQLVLLTALVAGGGAFLAALVA